MKTDNQQNVKEGQQIGSKIKKSNFFNEFFCGVIIDSVKKNKSDVVLNN